MLITFNIYFSKQIEMKVAEMLTSNFLVLFISNKNNKLVSSVSKHLV